MKNIPFLLSGIIVGLILFQSGLVAPAINKLIRAEDASIFLRFIWPKFFLIIGFISFVSYLIITFCDSNQNLFKYLFLAGSLLMLVCYVITPMINEAKDSSNEQLWSILHMLTILLTLLVLVINALIVFLWATKN